MGEVKQIINFFDEEKKLKLNKVRRAEEDMSNQEHVIGLVPTMMILRMIEPCRKYTGKSLLFMISIINPI